MPQALRHGAAVTVVHQIGVVLYREVAYTVGAVGATLDNQLGVRDVKVIPRSES